MPNILLQQMHNLPVSRQLVEHVERKGIGHPDTICDAVMESISVTLCQTYQTTAGRVLHYNLDKALLVAGATMPALGGGTVQRPMRLIFGGRATTDWQGQQIPVAEIAETTARHWMVGHLRFVVPESHVVFQNEIRVGSPELLDIFARKTIGANDTSVGVGYAPLTETERMVLAAERRLNASEFKRAFPESGEDVKVMGSRRGRKLTLIVALAFVDRHVPDEHTYFNRKIAIRDDLQRHLEPKLHDLDTVDIHINALDTPGRGAGGMYLTVLGTSAEGADSGQVGRGNRVNGLISFKRPMSTEAAAGKNPVSHVGKIYNLLSHQIANQIHVLVDGIEEVNVWLCSQIGQSVDQPWIISTQLVLAAGASLSDVQPSIEKIVRDELAALPSFTSRLVRGELSVC